MDFYERQHIQKLIVQQNAVKRIFDDFVRSASPLLAGWSERNTSSVWVGNAQIEKRIESLLNVLHDGLLSNITDNMTESWNRGNAKADELVKDYIQGMAVSSALREKMLSRNADALKSMLSHKDDQGLTVSKRVWNIAGSAKDNLEFYLRSGLSIGRAATGISGDIRQLLVNPDKRFRRVKDKNGNLVPSKPMMEFHPGQGVYRSSFKNALRLSATETNKAFRMADHDRWKDMDFVLGIEVERSPTHDGPCSICDAMNGKYPKDFVFTGWHPFCICIATPLLMNHEDFADFLINDAIQTGSVITDIPGGASEWMESHSERAKGWIGEPSFVRENRKYLGRMETDAYTNEEKKFTHARGTKEAMERAIDIFHGLYPDIPNTELAAIHHYTKKGGNYRQLNKQLDKGNPTEFNRAASELISRGLSKLPNYEGTVYRGVVMKRSLFNNIHIGNEFIENKFVSSSKDIEVVTNHFMKTQKIRKNEISVLYQIKSKKGKDIENISEFNGKLQSENQKEVLFDKNTKFKIIDISLNNDEATLIVEEL